MAKSEINQEVLGQWEEGHKREVLAVKQLGDAIGYGNMMSIASALWALVLQESGAPISGAFIPTISYDMKKKYGIKAEEEQIRRAGVFKKMLKTDIVLRQTVEPCIIQSAFLLLNGRRIIIYTGELGIISYECDKNWNKSNVPFATLPKEMMSVSPTNYHKNIRKMHGEENLMHEHSTKIDW